MLRKGWVSLFFAFAFLGVDKGCVFSPTTDTLVTQPRVQLQGWIQEYRNDGRFLKNVHGRVNLFQNGRFIGTVRTSSNKSWTKNVILTRGVNIFRGQTVRRDPRTGALVRGTLEPFLLEYRPDLAGKNKGIQKVYLDFSSDGSDIAKDLQAIARYTLSSSLSEAQLRQFVRGVQDGIRRYFRKAYADVRVVLTSRKDRATHVVRFYGGGSGCSLYGESPGDWLNRNKAQVSHIYIHTFKCVIVDLDRFFRFTPARRTDSMQERIEQIATYIGRTVVHEVGHSLGLVAEGSRGLHGCEGMHNCPDYDSHYPSDRFQNGRYIMDPGPRSAIHARAGFESPMSRKRVLPHFNKYNKSYLKIIHPR